MTQVRRRKVLYIPGYDPFPPRRYRELYRTEGKAQAAISGYDLALAPLTGRQRFGWKATLQDGQTSSEAEIEVLVWSDIVQTSMARSIPATYRQLARTAWNYIGSGALWRLMRLRKGPVIAALYPVLFLLVQLVLALCVVWGVWRVSGGLLPEGWAWGGLLIGLGLGYALLDAFRRWDGKFFAYYLMHDYAYSARLKGENPPELEGRMAQFGEIIAEALAEDVDEVLVVGHSSGAHLAVSVLADLDHAGRLGKGAELSLLTLGQVVPMVSFLPNAGRLRRDLRALSQSENLTWIDVTAPGDGCAFALCDPVAVSGVAPEGQRWPLVISAAFTQTLSPERWQELKRRYFRLHFQYLCAFDRPGDYDYFRITAGDQTLAARLGHRKHSPSRLSDPVNKFTSIEAR